jgi:hypothetical protein
VDLVVVVLVQALQELTAQQILAVAQVVELVDLDLVAAQAAQVL